MSKWLEKQKELEAQIAADMIEETDPVSPDPMPEERLESLYTWVKYDNIWSVSRRLGFTAEELLEHNDIDDPATIKPGDRLHLPVPRDLTKQQDYRVEVLPQPLQMHVSKEGGCRKWAFANMRYWSDAKTTGFFPEHTNVTILAVAKVLVEEENNSVAEAAYYLDAVSLGDYTTSGFLKWATGFVWQDLTEGEYVRPEPPAIAEAALQKQNDIEAVLEEKRLAAAQEEARDMLVEKKLADMEDGTMPNDFKKTLQAIEPTVCMIDIPEGIGEVDPSVAMSPYIRVHDFEGNRPFKRLFDGQEIEISSTFEFDGAVYGRPKVAAQNGLWYGIPMEVLTSLDELYNTNIDAESRAAVGGTLTWAERYIWVPLAKSLNRHKK